MKSSTHANRGMKLEKKIDISNKLYKEGMGLLLNYVASIHKIPTNVQITKDNGNSIVGFKKRGEMVDYVGVMLGGHAIAFDAKETKGKSFPLANLHDNQYEFLYKWYTMGATVFLVVYFSDYDKYYRLPFTTLKTYVEAAREGGRKSIPYKAFDLELIYQNGILHYLEGL